MDVEFKGLNEFRKILNQVDKNADKRIRKHLNQEGKKFIEAAKNNTPDSGDSKGRKIKNSYVNMRVVRNFKDFEKPIRNKAPHHHLVNNGHRLVSKSGEQIGYVQGRHYIEKTIAEKEGDFYDSNNHFLSELYKELIE